MPHLNFVTVDVFTVQRFEGNPLAICRIPKDQDVSQEQMQTIAREFNLSETIFIHSAQRDEKDGVPEWRVRIFVTTAEIPFAGHPTIGASVYALGTLANNSQKGRLICAAGPIEVDYTNGIAQASIPHNFHRHAQQSKSLEQVYALHPALKKVTEPPKSIEIASPVKGMNFIYIELLDLETLGLLDISGPNHDQLDISADEGWKDGLWGSFLYVITDPGDAADSAHVEQPVVKVRARMIQGSLEDPATGSASCGLSGLLAMKMKLGRKVKFEITQGVEMGRRSEIGVEVTLQEGLDALEKVVLSGSAVKVMEGELEYS